MPAVNARAVSGFIDEGSEDVIFLLGLVHLSHTQQYCIHFGRLRFEPGIDSGGRNRQLGHPVGP